MVTALIVSMVVAALFAILAWLISQVAKGGGDD